jgi:hypothetical protein
LRSTISVGIRGLGSHGSRRRLGDLDIITRNTLCARGDGLRTDIVTFDSGVSSKHEDDTLDRSDGQVKEVVSKVSFNCSGREGIIGKAEWEKCNNKDDIHEQGRTEVPLVRETVLKERPLGHPGSLFLWHGSLRGRDPEDADEQGDDIDCTIDRGEDDEEIVGGAAEPVVDDAHADHDRCNVPEKLYDPQRVVVDIPDRSIRIHNADYLSSSF